MFRQGIAWAAVTLVAACSSTPPAARPASAPRPEAVVAFDILHQDVEIAPFAEPNELTGAQTMVFQAQTAGDRLRFTGGPLQIATLSLDGRALEDWRTSGDAINIRLGRTLDANSRHSLRLTYEAAPGRGVRRSETLAYSTYFSCDWMLCNQADFADRFTFDLTIRTPRGMRTLGPGTELGAARDGEDELHRWRTTEPYSAYVHGFVAGRLRPHDVTSGCAARLDVLSSAPAQQVAALFGPTCAMLEYFAGRAGVPYPADRYSQLYVPDAWEAQEAISHSTLGGGAMEPMLTDPAEDWAVAHELAHQWWGNRVTATDLSQFWLNEGVVTFMVASWKEHRWGDAAYRREIELARSRWMRCREAWRDVPLAYSGDYPSLATRRCFQYSKAAVFLHELRTRMGEEAFWRGVADFTAAQVGRSVTSRDFEAAMQGATGVDLHPLFAEWVHPAAE
ncbi:M1 family aminopeptidase [Brevundimonas sp. PAMC22021]|uniref:M1 family aminopeptidase n=1 Tax=Brevundimonas sp. PAMC22021 TaxID=2861285 RepID=UPI001C635054|nr:M1 family aminopeptidase [Brevundimonas sp. PAMC22021]QYF86752.1 hypothetical protein KY493_13200 [Brevundimonas sp. PAMC22021]